MRVRTTITAVVMLFVIVLVEGCRDRTATETAPALTADYLAGSAWGPEEGPNALGKHLEFKRDGAYEDRWHGPGGCFYTGAFAISDEAVVLTKTGRQECVDNVPYVSRCVRQPAPDSPSYRIRLVCGKGSVYYRHGSPVPVGSALTIGGVNATATGVRMAECIDEIMFREKPDVSAKSYAFRIYCDGPERIEHSIRKGSRLIVMARTIERARVSSRENYWYYVFIESGECIRPERNRGWVFGEYVRFIEK